MATAFFYVLLVFFAVYGIVSMIVGIMGMQIREKSEILDKHFVIMVKNAEDTIEEIAEKFGAQRLIFGSGMPGLSGAASVALITYAKLDDTRKQMIAAGNLDRLLQEVEW